RQGDFSDVGTTGYAALTGIVRGSNNPSDGAMPTVLSQALGYAVTSGEPYWVPGCHTLADAQAGMCVFPNQVIPQAAWSPVAKAELKVHPDTHGYAGERPTLFLHECLQKHNKRRQICPPNRLGQQADGKLDFLLQLR